MATQTTRADEALRAQGACEQVRDEMCWRTEFRARSSILSGTVGHENQDLVDGIEESLGSTGVQSVP